MTFNPDPIVRWFLNLTAKTRLHIFMTTNASQSRADQLEERLVNFAVRIIQLTASLPKTPAGKHVSNQILRAGTSPAPNYGEARGAESLADFVHKLRVVLKELNETSIWLRVIEQSLMLPAKDLTEIRREGNELSRIFTSSLKTTRSRRDNRNDST